MDNKVFEEIIEERISKCKEVLVVKAKEYATEDRLHNFKVAAELQGCSPVKALAGMMAKHTVSAYDLINDFEAGETISQDMWNEKIGDSINYLLLLEALIVEDFNNRMTEGVDDSCYEECADDNNWHKREVRL